MSAMANTTQIVTTVTKIATKEKMPNGAEAASRVNILEFCEEHYEDILPVMDKIRCDKGKEVHARLDFRENSKKSQRMREDSQNSSGKTMSARYRNPSERPQIRDRLRNKDGNVFGRLEMVPTVEAVLINRTLLLAETAPTASKNRVCMRISGFMHGVNNPELTKRLNEHVPKTMEEMMIATAAFIRGKTATASKIKFTLLGSHRTSPNGKFKPPLPMVTPVLKRSSNKFCEFQNDKGHSTNECVQLRKQIEELVRAGKLSHFIKEIRLDRDQQKSGKKDAPVKDKAAAIYMIQPWQRVTRQKVTQSFALVKEITFPPLAANKGTLGPLVIEAEISGHAVQRIYVEGGSSMETVKALGNFRGRRALYKSMDEFYDNEVTITIQGHHSKAWDKINPSSTIHGSRNAQIPTTPKDQAKKAEARHKNFKVAIHPDFSDQEITIGGTVSIKARTELSKLLKRNLDIFAWQPQKKRGQAPERAKAIQVEVQKLVEAGILREVYYHDWLSNPIMVKKYDDRWRMCVDFTDLNKACPQDCYPLSEIDWKAFYEKQKLTGPNFIDWYRQLRIVLSTEDKLNYLEKTIPPALVLVARQQVAPEILVAHAACVFANASAFSVLGNNKLCGGLVTLELPKCKEKGSKKKRYPFFIFVFVIAPTLMVVLCCVYLLGKKKRKSRPFQTSGNERFLKVSYNELLMATDGFSTTNLTGDCGFSFVYKGILNSDDDKFVAIKVLLLQNRRAHKSILAECEAWRNIRNLNLLKIITACSSVDFQRNDFKALVYDFMPNGNYLHIHGQTTIVHGDLKPSKILLHDDRVAHVGDFGLARLLGTNLYQNSSTGVKGTISYAPPEYGIGNDMTSSGDIYSFGILLLEFMTGKKPTDDMFIEALRIYKFASIPLPDHVIDVIDNDAIVLQSTKANAKKVEECLVATIKIEVPCSMDSPPQRMKTKIIMIELQRILGLIPSLLGEVESNCTKEQSMS
nr:protein kinase-like domain-containing protein [Tanacetum cinerariifolium]